MKTPAHSPRSAFSLIELLVVIAIILILLGLIIPLSRIAREKSNLVTCGHNMKSVLAGLIAFPVTNDGYLPWAGDVDSNRSNDWMWGGQGDTAPKMVPDRFDDADWGFHPEAGSVYTLITGLPIIRKTDSSNASLPGTLPSQGKPFEDTVHNTMEHKMYRCPSTGDIGKSQRNNFSMNDAYDTRLRDNGTDGSSTTDWTHMRRRAQRSAYGVRISTVRGPSHKIILINEDPYTMKNASFYPGGSAAGREINGVPHVTHDGKINMGFVDGSLGRFDGTFVLDSQKNNILSTDGKLNNMQYWYAPAD